MPRPQIYCRSCGLWWPYDSKEITARGARRRHEQKCLGPAEGHPDLIELDAELEYWFGEAK